MKASAHSAVAHTIYDVIVKRIEVERSLDDMRHANRLAIDIARQLKREYKMELSYRGDTEEKENASRGR